MSNMLTAQNINIKDTAMKKLFLLFAILSITSFLNAQPWSEQVSGVTVQLTSVHSISATVVWACGYSGTVLRTTNAGVNWINATGTGIPTTVSLIAIAGINSTTAFAAGYISGSNTWVWKTTDGGINWTQVFTETGGFIDAVWINPSNTSVGFMAGDPVGGRWSLWKTTNGGSNWDSTGLFLPAVGADASWNNAIFVVYPKIWIGTNNSRVYYSSNFGANWITQSTGTEVNGYSVWFSPDGLNGYLGGAQLWQTTNGGNNWTAQTVPGTGNISSLTASPVIVNNPLLVMPSWCSRGTNTIYFSVGGSFASEYVAAAGTYRHMSNIQYGRGIWAVRNNGGISYHPPLAGITKIEGEIPGSFSLAQNYPNPFNPMTNIAYSIAGNKSVIVTMKIYNILGNEVAVPVNQMQIPGMYNLLYDASSLSAGVYFYNITAGSYKETRKMVLVK